MKMRRLLLAGALAAILLTGCGSGSTKTVTTTESPHRAAQKEHIAEMCAEDRVEGFYLQGCRDFYKLRAEESGE